MQVELATGRTNPEERRAGGSDAQDDETYRLLDLYDLTSGRNHNSVGLGCWLKERWF